MKFYEKLPVTPMVKRAFVNEIAQIVWRNKFSPETLNVQPGNRVRELEVIEVELKGDTLNEAVLKTIDRGIPVSAAFPVEAWGRISGMHGYNASPWAFHHGIDLLGRMKGHYSTFLNKSQAQKDRKMKIF